MNIRSSWCSRQFLLVAALAVAGISGPARAGNPDGDLRVEIVTAYNLVVDSNAESPSTYAPKSAYIGAKFCNDGTAPLTNVWAYIGDLAAGTPGTYPSRAHPGLVGPLPGGEFALTHEGGTMGATDATRYVGTIDPGECVTVYWLVSYPQLDENGDAVWGPSVKPDDDLWMEYDVWATAQQGAAYYQADDSQTLTCRNEISAMANKIWPNGANKVPQEYQDLLQQYVPLWTNTSAVAEPGAVLRTEGIWYDLGNVGDGFDNDGDLVPDRNAWLQPVGDPDIFDPSCFRMVRTYVMIIVKLNDGTEQVIVTEDQLYFTQIPANNRGAVGYVMYEFVAIGSGCVSTLTPYQEVASGFDNEKFNGDYGAPGQTLTGGTSLLAIAKSADPIVTRPGSNIAYTVTYTNSGPDPSGRPDIGLPVVVQDSIPTGTVYVAGSATAANVLPGGVSSYEVHYSTNHGLTWSLSEPAVATNVTDVQWWLSDPLPAGGAGTVRFTVKIANPWPFPSPIVPNTAGLSFGNTTPFMWAHAQTLLLGNNALGDTVWRDDGAGGGLLGNQLQEGGETGITGVTVRLYYDLDGDGTGDFLFATTNTGANGYYTFTNLPDGHFTVVVETTNSHIPFGYTPTTPTSFSIPLDPARTNVNPVVNWTADFGFAPALTLIKTHTSTNAVREGQLISYNLTVSNNLPGNGTGSGSPATYYAWASSGGADYKNTEWVNYSNAFYPPGPDGLYTSNQFAGPTTVLSLTNFTVGAQLGTVTNVSLVMPIQMVPPIGGDDTVTIEVRTLSPSTIRFSQTYLATSLVSGVWTVPRTGNYAWTWADFDSNAVVTLSAKKNSGGTAGGWILLDAVGFKIESDQTVGVAGDTTTLDPVPLVDRYDPAKLQFVSAQPPESSVETDPTGTIYWDNVGPIYPGGTSTVAVTFKLLEPPGNTNTVVTNTTWVTNAYFTGGAHANNATSSVVVTQFPAATVGDYVWRDLNGDGIQNETNMGIANVAVSITPPAGIDLGRGAGLAITNWTDASGYYLFESIPATGVYTVRVVTATLPGGIGTQTYDEDAVKDSTHAVYLDIYAAPASTNNLHLTTDFGYTLASAIEGTIWHDYDRGQESYREAGEDWMTNVTVYLCASPSPCGPGASIATNVTTTNGYFRFTGNFDGTYTVFVATNSGMLSNGSWHVSFDTDGTNTANYAAVTVPLGGVGRADFSYFRTGPYRIGDTLFYDWNGDGAQDVASEEGIPDVTVWLYEDANSNGVVDAATDALVATTVTTTNGYYVFTNLFATNTYLVMVDRADPDLPASCHVTADPWGALDARSVVTIVNADNFDQDFGFQPYGSGAIGDTVWLDRNADGIQLGTQEPGLPDVEVRLYVDFDGNGDYVLLRTTNTDANGLYLFDELPDGDYRVVVDDADADLPVDAYGNVYYPSTAVSFDVEISGGNTYLDADFGFAPYGAIGDTVFWDLNRNGDQDFNDPGVPGVDVYLYADANGNGIYDTGETLLATETTDATGFYVFSGLLPDDYVVVVETASGPLAGTDQTADPQSDGLACDDPLNVVPCDDQCGWSLAPAQIFMGADFGYAPRGVIGDTVWVDANDNGLRDAGELGIPYVDVILYSNGVAIATNTTDADGIYGFSGLVDFSNYGVRVATNDVDFPAGLTNTWTADGTFDNYTTNIVMSGGAVTSIGGYPCTDCDLNVDFGYRYAGNNSLSGTIGLDAPTYDGLMNDLNPSGPGPGESPYAGVPVTLYLWNDDGDGIIEAGETTQLGSTVTDANGDYAFTGLPNGDGDDKYVVASAAPESYLTLTTTNGSIAGVTVFSTTNLQGYAVSARLAVSVAPSITNMDFAYASQKSYDYGDLPDSYGTLLADGARHVVATVPDLYLGAGVDTESNGQPSAGADGDDLAGTDDEDGVVQLTNAIWTVGAAGGSVEVTVGAGSGWLLGYIDFNGDGDFVDAGEMIASQAVSATGGNGAGVYTNSFTIPAGTFSATSSTPLYARFRLFPEEPLFPELAYAGTAADGEVEDYLWHLAGLGDYVWYDVNGDGIQDVGEPPIVGVRVFLDLNDDGVWQAAEPAATTDADGLYGIGGLIAGTYVVRVDTNTLPVGVLPTYDYDGIGTLHVASVDVAQLDQFFDEADFGYLPPVDIGDRVWFDANRDGIQNAGETDNFIGIPVALLDSNGTIVAQTVTDDNGLYLFEDMPAQTYFLRFDLASISTNENVSTYKVGSDDEVDSDAIIGNVGDYAWTAAVVPVAGESLLTVDLGITTRGSTRADLAEVWGEWVDGQGRVAWRTAAEFGTAGFFVWRIDPASGEETRLNHLLVPSAFQEGGATYGLVDPAAREDEEGAYRIEEVELSGEIVGLGSRSVRFDAPAPAAKSTRDARVAKPIVQAVLPKASQGPSSVLKVQAETEGLYGVELQAIADGMGLALESVQALAEAGSLKITEQARTVPVSYDAARGRLLFHAKAPDRNWYSHADAYLISAGEGLAMPQREPDAAAGASVFPVTLHFEENLFLFNMNRMPDDFYFWVGVVSGTNDLLDPIFPLDLNGYAGGDMRLKVRLMGWSSTTNAPDHHAEFYFNGTLAGDVAFDGQDVAETEMTIPAGTISDGINELRVHGRMPEDQSHSFFVVDWVEASFDRQLAPGTIPAPFAAAGASSISAQAFAEPIALALDAAGNPTRIADESGGLPSRAWTVAPAEDRYEVLEANDVPLLVPKPAAADAWFLSETNAVDYLVIAPRELAPAAQELADYRAGQGLRSGVAVFEDVCDLLAGGVRTPEAISGLLRYAASTWAASPRMVLLAGSGHYDYLGVNTSEANHLPPLLVQMPVGVCASDALLADTGGDELPDVAIGRLPARTEAELAAMIAKIKAYEAEFGAEWQNQLVLVADNADPAGYFAAANERLAELVSAPYSVAERIELDTMDLDLARADLLGWFNSGAGFINYVGHGSIKTLAAENLLAATNVDEMVATDRPSVAVTLTCLAARYEVPAVESLGERLMQREQGGAVAVLGPSGLSQNAPATELGEAFYRTILQDGMGELGMAFLRARRSLPASLFSKDTIAVYNLLGDPALRIAGNDPAAAAKLPAQIFLQDLAQTCDGTPRAVSAATEPAGLAVRITYDGHAVAPTAVGSYAVVATIATADYEGTAAGTLVVSKAAAAVSLTDLEQIYDGTPKTPAATTEPAGLAVEFTYDGEATPPTAAGTYAVVATVADAQWAGVATGLLTVAKAPATVLLAGLAQVFDETPRIATATTVPEGLSVEVRYDGSETPPVGAGSYVVTAVVDDPNFEGMASDVLTVSKASATVVLGSLAQTYDGRPKYATATTAPGELAVDFTYAGSARAPVAAGSYAVVGTVSDPNWQGSAAGTLAIGKADQTIQFASIADQITTAAVELSATASSGLPVSFAVVSGPAVLLGGTSLSFSGPGTVVVAARQGGNENWNAAPEATQVFNVVPVVLSSTRVLVRENGEGRFFVKLSQAPAANTTVTVARCAGSESLSVASGAELVFKASNWDAWQPVTLAADQDANGSDETATFRVSTAGAADRQLEAVALDGDAGENLASPARGTAISGTRGYFLPLAIDGIHASRTNYAYTIWSNPSPGTMILDLQGITTVSRLRLLNWDWSFRSHQYMLESSEDGEDWSLLVDARSGEHRGWEDWVVDDTPARYLRFTGTSNSANTAVCIAEWEVYGPTGSTPRPVCSAVDVSVREAGEGRFFVRLNQAPESNVVVGVACAAESAGLSVKSGQALTFKPSNWNVWQPVVLAAEEDANAEDETASFRVSLSGAADRYVKATALDDDIGENVALASSGTSISGSRGYLLGAAIDGTHLSSTNYAFVVWPGSMTLDLQGEVVVSRVRLLNWDWTLRSHRYRIEASLDGANWSVLADASEGEHRGWEDWPVADQRIRFLRFTGLYNSANSAVCIAEWEVYGTRTQRSELEVSATNVNVREAGEGRFFVRLDRAPAGDVAVAVARVSGDSAISAEDGATLTFKPSNWNVWQAVTLVAQEDENAAGETALFRISAPDAQDRFVEAATLDDDIGENLALASNGARISGTRAYLTALAIDGQHLSRANYGYAVWTNEPPGAMTLDLGAARSVARVRLLNWDWNLRSHRYRIETSEDGLVWSVLADASTGEHHGWEDWAADGRAIRYLRLTGLYNSANSAVCIAEWEVYGAAPAAAASAAAVNVVEDPFPLTIVTSDDGPDYTNGWAAVDGDTNTCWIGRAGAGGWYIAVGYDAVWHMTNLVVDLAEGSATQFQCLHSLDAVNWQEWPTEKDEDSVDMSYLWILFPADGPAAPEPRVIEIRPQQ